MPTPDQRLNFGNRDQACRTRAPVSALGTTNLDETPRWTSPEEAAIYGPQLPVYGPHLPTSEDARDGVEMWTQLQEGEAASGSVPVGSGMGSVVRIPVPGTPGMAIELDPRGWVPKGGSTSKLFIQDIKGDRHLRLDYGFNAETKQYDYHWNVRKAEKITSIKDHTPVGKTGKALYHGAQYYRIAGRFLLVAGAAVDVYSVVVAKKRVRQVLKVASGWAGAWAGCKIVGAGGAAAGSSVPGYGTAIGGIAGCVIGSVGGYNAASWAAGEAYDVIEEIYFEEVPSVAPPQN